MTYEESDFEGPMTFGAFKRREQVGKHAPSPGRDLYRNLSADTKFAIAGEHSEFVEEMG